MKKLYFLSSVFFFLNSLTAQVYYSEDFESGNGSQWKYTDLDGDGQGFLIANATSLYSGVGTKSLLSYSWNNAVLTPDNLVSSLPITLPSGVSNIFLKYNVASQKNSDGAEHYSVYVTPSNDPNAILTKTPVLEETLPMAGNMLDRTIDLSAFAGQTVYLSFRHFNCTNMYVLLLDNLSIETLTNNDAKLVSGKIDKYIAVNTPNTIKYTVKNNGGNNITSLELNWNDGTDHKATVSTNIKPGEIVEISHPTIVSYSELVDKNIVATVTQVNASPDAIPSDNSVSLSTTVASQTIPKKVVIEEGTGTWCGWCTRGIVALDKVNADYPDDQISIAVHGGSSTEPMQVAGYINSAGYTGFPGMNVDRELKNVDIGPDTINNYVDTRKNISTPAKLLGEFSIVNDQLTANVTSQFFINKANVNYKLAVILLEDDVKGTTTYYKQANYYAGGANGPMGGFENMPSSIPAAQMSYKHVARALLGGYSGQAGSVPVTITDGQTVSYTFNYTIPSTQIKENLHAVLLLLDASNGTIVNAAKLTRSTLAVNDINKMSAGTKIYPNPAKSDFNIKFVKDGVYKIAIFDMAGREVKNYGNVSSNAMKINLPINLTSGKYFVNIAQDAESMTKELIVK